MHSFQRSVLPLPFFRSVAAVAVARENGIAGNVFPLTAFEVTRFLPFCRRQTAVSVLVTRTLTGRLPTAERQK